MSALALGLVAALAAQPTLTTFTLPDGLDVVVVEHAKFSSCSVRLVVRAGAGEDFPGKRGLAHILEHTVLGGPAGMAQLTSRTATINALTTMSATTFTLEAPHQSCEDELRRYLSLVTDAKLRKSWFINEKEVIAREALYFSRRRALIETNLFGNSPELIIGTSSSRDSVELVDVREFFQRYYTPDRMTLVVTGLEADAVRRALDGGFKLLPVSLLSDEAREQASMAVGTLQLTDAPGTMALVAPLDVHQLPACRIAAAAIQLRLLQSARGAQVSVDCSYAYQRLLLVVVVFGQLDDPAVSSKTLEIWRQLKPLAKNELGVIERHFDARELSWDAPELADRIAAMAVWLSGKDLFDAVPGWWVSPDTKTDLTPIRNATQPRASAVLMGN
jgi:predicted Zn-dependent peptidase